MSEQKSKNHSGTREYERIKCEAREWMEWAKKAERVLFPELGKEDFIDALPRCSNLRSLVKLLLRAGRAYGIKRIRFHRYSSEQKKLVSVESAGHGRNKAIQLRMGNIFKFRESCPLKIADSFWCLEKRNPAVFVLDEANPKPLTLKEVRDFGKEKIYLLSVSADQCESFFEGRKGRVCVDFPLLNDREIIGKLSCDSIAQEVNEFTLELLRRFWQYVKLAAPFIQTRRQTQVKVLSGKLAGVQDEIERCSTAAELYRYCTTTLADRFRCKHASIFTVLRDDLGCEKLVLRKTSYRPSQCLEDGAAAPHDIAKAGFYCLSPIPENAITTWVALKARSLRLQNLQNGKLLEQQLRVYDPHLRWLDKISDSSNHTSFLGVPIQVQGKVQGVLRCTEKRHGLPSAYFTEVEERLLQQVANDWIGPKLQHLFETEYSNRLSQISFMSTLIELLTKAIVSSLRYPHGGESEKLLSDAMMAAYPHRKGSRRLYLVNMLQGHTGTFKHRAIAGHLREKLKGSEEQEYNLHGTFTDYLLQNPNRAFFFNDLPYAQQKGFFLHVVGDSVCAMGRGIHLGKRWQGAIVLESDRYDLGPETNAKLLVPLLDCSTRLLMCPVKRI